MDFETYDTEGYYDELLTPERQPWPRGEMLVKRLAALPSEDLQRRQKAAELAMLNMGITFNVYGHEAGTEPGRRNRALQSPAPRSIGP